MFQSGDLLHIYLYIHLHLLNCVHKYTAICNGIGLFALKEVVVVEGGLLHIHLQTITFTIVFINTDIYDGAVLLTLKDVVVF